jgi:demethylmenaquinone methyltransferase/2-methoxy-6-polyprenyl-1,4-benzoquinol methylase
VTVSPAEIRRMFDRIARRYDLVNSLISLGLHKGWKRLVAEAAQVPSGGLALDVCAGTGDIAVSLARKGARVVALDFSSPMMAVGRRRAAGLPVAHVRGDALLLPFPDNAFDAATIGFSLRNLISRARLFAEMARVVRPGGWLVSLETSQPPNRLIRRLYHLYLGLAITCASLIAEGAAYRYLAGTIIGFPPAEAVAKELREAGLVEVRIRRLFFGAVAVHYGQVPASATARSSP